MFFKFNPVDVGGVGTRIQTPPVTAEEEHVFLVRGDFRSNFIIPGINSRAHIPEFSPGAIRPSQGEVQVRFRPAPCPRLYGVEHHE